MRSIRFVQVLAMFVLICGCASSQSPAVSTAASASSLPAVSKRFALVGENGLLVEVVDFENGEALLRVTGSEGPLVNKVVSHRRALDGQDLRYTTQWGGREWLTLLRSGTSSYIGTYWSLYQRDNEPERVTYAEDRSAKVDADKLFATHQEQVRSGELEKLQRFDQSADRGREDEVVATSVAAASRECGSTLKAAIAWDTVTDQALLEHSVADYCAGALRAMCSACLASPELKAFIQKQVKEVSCRFDNAARAGAMNLDAGHLTWSVNFDLGDVDNAAGKELARLAFP